MSAYEAPTMAQVRAATGTNGLVAASLFAGGGGSSTGYRLAGFRIAYANEYDEHALQTYRLNADPATVVDGRDVREVAGSDILEAAGGALDLLDGSPPCQDFSTAGRRNMAGERASLSYEHVRLVGEVRPRAFVFENVQGLAMGRAIGHLRNILDGLRGHGYRAAHHLLDASLLGVPQQRKRLIIVGFREDEGIDPEAGFPRPSARRTTVNDAMPHIDYHAPAPTVMTAGFDGYHDLRVLRDQPIAAFKRLSSFPDDFEIPGTERQQMFRIGDAHPPLMVKAIGGRIRDALLGSA